MKYKWHLVTELTESGLLRLMKDLRELYDRFNGIDNTHIAFRIRDGKYDVNVLTKDWDALKHWYLEDTFADRYREENTCDATSGTADVHHVSDPEGH